MLFLRPALLWGLLGVAVPVLIHLLGRRRVRAVPIATLRFLERARARASSRWRLRRILLLLARAAVLGCLAVLFAGPGCQEVGAGADPTTWILLLDTSPSMGAARGNRSCLEQGKAELLRILNRSGRNDRFLFVTTRVGDDGAWQRGFTADTGEVRKEIATAGVEYGEHRIESALERAFQLLEGVPGGRMALATDLQASDWGSGRVPGSGAVPVRILDVGFADPRNAWISGVEESDGVVRARLASVGSGEEGGRRTVRLRLEGGPSATAFVTGHDASFQLSQPARDQAGVLQLEPGGDLASDDEFPFVVRGSARVKVLLVNGDPRGFELRDELFFVRRALSSPGRLKKTFEARETRATELSLKDLDGVQVIVLANPGPLSAALVAGLRAAVEKGAGLLVTAGDRWKGPEGAGALASILPMPLRDAIALTHEDPSRRPYESLDVQSLRPPLEGFRDGTSGDLSRTRVWTYWALDREGSQAGETLMRLENGAPLLVTRRVGKGVSVLLATTIDRDGSDLCLQSAFLPWLERVLLFAAGRLGPRVASRLTAGVRAALPYREPVAIQGPRGPRVMWRPSARSYVPPEPGIYRVFSGERQVDSFAAGIPETESDLTRLSSADLDARLGKGRYRLGAGGDVPPVARKVGRRDVSGRIAVALLLALALEALLSARWAGRRGGAATVDLRRPAGRG